MAPLAHIRVVAIGLHWRDGRLLAAEVRDDAGGIKGVRPLGGEVAFGEGWRYFSNLKRPPSTLIKNAERSS